MNKFSVVASLTLLGLFLIPSPSEGYVLAFIDLSDQRLQSPWLQRQEKPMMTDKRLDDSQEDGGILFGSKDNNKPMIMKPLPRPEYDPLLNEITSNQVSVETNQNENNIAFSSDDRKALEERIQKRDIMTDATPLNNEQDNIVPTQNGNDSAGPTTIVYVQMTSRL